MKKIKVTIIGDKNVGKTSILNAYLDRPLCSETTIGLDFFTQSIAIQNERCSISWWDTAGAERFQSLTQTYLRDSDLIIVVYDLGTRISNLGFWMRQVEQNRPTVVGILGNKTDLTRLNTEDLQDILYPWLRQNWKFVTGKCSSRKPKSVKTFFRRCLLDIIQTDSEQMFGEEAASIVLKDEKTQIRTCCT